MKKIALKVAYFNLFAELFSSVNRHKSPILFHKNGTLRKKLSSKEVYFSLIAEIFSSQLAPNQPKYQIMFNKNMRNENGSPRDLYLIYLMTLSIG